VTDHAEVYRTISKQMSAAAGDARAWMAGSRQIADPDEAQEAQQLRQLLEDLKEQAEMARDSERLPLLAAAQEVQAKWQPRLADVKQAHDLLRHALKAWSKRQQQKATA